MSNPKAFDLLEPGVLLKGALARSLGADRATQGRSAWDIRLGLSRIVEEIGRGGMGDVYLVERDDD